jgi:hypothetical protein
MSEFYDHPDGTIHFRAAAGGAGGGATSVFDGVATEAHMKEHAPSYGAYLARSKDGFVAPEVPNPPTLLGVAPLLTMPAGPVTEADDVKLDQEILTMEEQRAANARANAIAAKPV